MPPSTEYQQGQQSFHQGTAADDNPFPASSQQHEDWQAGWQDAAATTGVGDGGAPEPVEDPPATDPTSEAAPEETSSAESSPPSSGSPSDSGAAPSAPTAEATTEEAPEPLPPIGDVGYERLIELLENPPVGEDGPIPGFPPDGEIPDDLSDWLEAFKQPLAFLAVDQAVAAVQSRLNRTDRGRLKELYKTMSPEQIAAVMQANAEIVGKYADQRVAEAAVIASLQQRVAMTGTRYLLTALAAI